ncbi:Anaerobic dimethyl sulfoxide reductase chain B [Sporomusa silvacetica DSM 10669]|uniref:Anaerobic dimethyl sulfoxide reductase chain B n=1 Tax=Sporomusa silvacetica DSM 10669 TaxID=1123289 RepID=A0ABZ3IHA3_9FIRM|nr:4Fe-4S dicluster domain-containing protein [Sporomusa silvacetica]OZC14895.1 anaerobic dimethyl sulfoxide reductase chain B [Sporomusa silvacetica DSM 10669]
MTQIGFHYDMSTCIGCRACQIACKDKNNLKVGVIYRQVYDRESGVFPNPRIDHLSLGCNHCANPKCTKNCPTGALYKQDKDGVVLHNKEKCIGCKMCLWSCPYGVPQYNEEEGKAGKCDLCVDLLAKGEEPACVTTCVMRSLHVGEIEELRKQYGNAADVKGLPSSEMTHPSLCITTKKK